MSSWNKMCRACLTTQESFMYCLCENVSPEIFFFCTSIEICQDELPKTLCNLCYEKLNIFSEFKQACILSHDTLYNLIKSEELAATCNEGTFIEAESQRKENKDQCIEPNTAIKSENNSNDLQDSSRLKHDMNSESDVYEDTMDRENIIEPSPCEAVNKKTKKKNKLNGQRKCKLKLNRRHHNFTCEICQRKFIFAQRFEAHKLEHEGKETSINCSACNKAFMTWNGLRRHNKNEHTVINPEKLKCTICGKSFKTIITLKMHQKMHGERRHLVCDICGKGYTTQSILKAHLDTHKENRERLFTCEHCGKKFYTNTILLSHVSRQHSGRKYVCQICSYPFTDKHNLAKHILMIHEGKKLHKCEICNKSYSTRSSLIEHKRIHSGERPFICSYCPKRFSSKRHLSDHIKIHTGIKPHKCSVCGQAFTQKGTMKRHMKVHNATMRNTK